MKTSDFGAEGYDYDELKKLALLIHLQEMGDLEIKLPQDVEESEIIESKIEDLEAELMFLKDDEKEKVSEEIDTLKERLDELNGKIGINQVEDEGEYYGYLTQFQIPDLYSDGRTWTVGDEEEMQNATELNIKQMIREGGLTVFSKSFLESHLDDKKIEDFAYDVYYDDVHNNPESFFEDSQRLLSDRQDEEIRVTNSKISRLEELLINLENLDSDTDEVQQKIEFINEKIEELKSEIEYIEENPDGDFPDDLMEDRIKDLASDAVYDGLGFLNEFGVDIEDYVDVESLIEDAIETDGHANFLNHYDGTSDEVRLDENLFYVMRID